jgi:hypothetical protein
MDDSHGTLIDLRLPIKRATADILDFSLDKTQFRSAHSKAYKVTIGGTNFEVVAYFTTKAFCDARNGVPIASGVLCVLPLSLLLPGTGKA